MTTTANLDGWFKRRYGEKQNLVPGWALLAQDAKFSNADRIGDSFNFPVKVRRGGGMTWNGGANVGTMFTLNAASAGVRKNATIAGTEFVHRDAISYGAASRAIEKGEAAFGDAVDEVVLDMMEVGAFAQEMALLYGGKDIGAVLSNPSGAGTGTQTFVITLASWPVGIWAQMEGQYIDAYDPTLVTKRNATGDVTVAAVDIATRTLTLTGAAADLDAIANSDVLVPRGANGNWFSGVDAIVTNAGTLFGISAATYNLWKGNSVSAGSAALTFATLQKAVSLAVGRGLSEDVVAYCSPFTWSDLNDQQAALTRYVQSTKGGLEYGTKSIKYYGVHGGVIEMKPHPMVKAGEAFVGPTSRLKRIGSTEFTFQLPNSPSGNDRFFRELENQAGFELRGYWDQALIITQPAKWTKITGIVNDSL